MEKLVNLTNKMPDDFERGDTEAVKADIDECKVDGGIGGLESQCGEAETSGDCGKTRWLTRELNLLIPPLFFLWEFPLQNSQNKNTLFIGCPSKIVIYITPPIILIISAKRSLK
ncbi:MAG: hypothetical protein H5T40_05350 [Methanobacteriales archaeon]|nr:hypothetical protein [Methanobacteriales archaeon]